MRLKLAVPLKGVGANERTIVTSPSQDRLAVGVSVDVLGPADGALTLGCLSKNLVSNVSCCNISQFLRGH